MVGSIVCLSVESCHVGSAELECYFIRSPKEKRPVPYAASSGGKKTRQERPRGRTLSLALVSTAQHGWTVIDVDKIRTLPAAAPAFNGPCGQSGDGQGIF